MSEPQALPTRIYLMRHAEAAPSSGGQRDFDRDLSSSGYGQAEIVAEIFADKGYRPDIIISSTALRCRQTAKAINRALNLTVNVTFVDSLYEGALQVYLDIIAAQNTANAVMLVGHNPVIRQTLKSLVGHEAAANAAPGGFPTGGLAVLDSDGGNGKWKLIDFLRP